ncbi:NUDIX hydrolase [Maritimibacter dapengensis]|uniref:NUDIX hydrolase n=1 Tax=Maritimibacter dapengensis TaxID=2836868 RepID=A0ABS6T2G4_9RHOB|nr:NUDIX hydrolase [Maritimibacter dapengensis]MBV7378766.1 NUDIX hydrolase [Maritimibacter dapengensis]
MKPVSIRQPAFRLKNAGKRDVRTQFCALPYRIKDGKPQVLMVTSRATGRWILPKGWPMHMSTPAEAAATEAYEEAGVKGVAIDNVLGFYTYTKTHDGVRYPVVAAVFPVRVDKVLRNWPEKGQRKRKWVSQKKAARLLSDRGLRDIVKQFDPRAI